MPRFAERIAPAPAIPERIEAELAIDFKHITK